ncbi:MAG TPA: hypothetical protein VKB79_02025 [Bryobacteraceae bacterium]|nr:hypothetical protein [Bryobacteraceae bacterium]
MNVIAGQKLFLIQPASNTTPLKSIMQPPRERLVFVAVPDETGAELYRLVEDRRQILNQALGKAAASKK